MRKKIIIDGQETNYSVTDDAKIFNDSTGRELKGTYATNEYHSIQLMINGKPKTFMFHRLVAQAFCDNPNNYTIVDHIDRNKHNDNADNLRWVSAKENANNVDKKAIIAKRRINQKYTGDFTEKEWKPVFRNSDYMIDSEGTVVNIKTKNILFPQDRHGYYRINIGGCYHSNHILVWEAFNNQKVPEGMQVDHINGIKSNNSLNNLRLVNSSENMKNAYYNGHKNQVGVKQYTLEGKYIASYPTIRQAAQSVNALEASLKEATLRHGICNGYYWLRKNDNISIELVMYDWIPDGYSLIKEYPTYCINEEGKVYNKRNKKHVSIRYRSNGEPYVILKSKRINIKTLLNEYTLCPKNFLIAGKA